MHEQALSKCTIVQATVQACQGSWRNMGHACGSQGWPALASPRQPRPAWPGLAWKLKALGLSAACICFWWSGLWASQHDQAATRCLQWTLPRQCAHLAHSCRSASSGHSYTGPGCGLSAQKRS